MKIDVGLRYGDFVIDYRCVAVFKGYEKQSLKSKIHCMRLNLQDRIFKIKRHLIRTF